MLGCMSLRASDWISILGDVLPERWRQIIGGVVLTALIITGTTTDVFVWLVEDIAGGLQETILDPMFARLIESADSPN